VDPIRGQVLVDRAAGGSRESRTVKDGRIDSVIVPGFWIDAGWLFRPELPSSRACLDEILGR